MNNKDIEKLIQDSFNKIQVNQIDDILSDCKKSERKVVFMQETNRNGWLPKLAVALATFMFVIGAVFVVNNIGKFDNVVSSTISLDVNPSIEIKINKEEKVIDVIGKNDEAITVIGDMDFKGSDLKVTVNALIGSLVRNGYINELTNSILVSIEDSNDAEGRKIETELLNEISNLLADGSVLSQYVNADDQVKELASKYNISLGKAQLVKELADKTTLYNYEDLAKLTINELNILSQNLKDSSITRNGSPSDKNYIGIDKAKEIALQDLGVSEADVKITKAKLDYDNQKMVYEIEFINNNIEYEYDIDALTGAIIYVDREYERKQNTTTQTTTSTTTTVNNTGVNNLIGEEKAKQIALSNAGVSQNDVTGYRIKRDYDDGIVKYEIDFYVGNVEYEYDIDANTGAVLEANKDLEDDYRPTSTSKAGVYNYSGTTYKVENGQVYEYDDGRWELEADKKVENGVVYEYDDGVWEADKKEENGVTYEYDDGQWQPDSKVENGVEYEYENGQWQADNDNDDHDDHDDDDDHDDHDDHDDDDDDD